VNLAYQHRDKEALPLYTRAQQILATSTGNARNALAVAYAGTGSILLRKRDLRGAEDAYRKALATRIEVYGERHPNVAMDLYNLAIVLEKRNKLAEALRTRERSEVLRKELLVPDNPHRLETEDLCSDLRANKR
jgi:tetratricopeptide (TPR) repeat protein